MKIKEIKKHTDAIRENIEQVIVGQQDAIDLIMTAFFAGGHVLIEDSPGTGKTTLAKAFAKSIAVDMKRVQFTPDLMPSDITGINIFNQKTSEFELIKGPLFTNILLADEINRATPRTQSSLLEAMEEKQATIDGKSRKLAEPFFVIATENPIETLGTYPLPIAELDRFVMKIGMKKLERREELGVIERFMKNDALAKIDSVCNMEAVREISDGMKGVYVHACIRTYTLDIIERIREHVKKGMGVSTRGVLALIRCAQARAAIMGRKYVEPDDIIYLAPYVLGHRLNGMENVTNYEKQKDMVLEMVKMVAVPTEKWEK